MIIKKLNFLGSNALNRRWFSKASLRLASNLPRTKLFVNGRKEKHVFPESEFQSRITILREYMQNNKLNACVFTSYHNINYYSGFLYCGFGRKYAHLVTDNQCRTIAAFIDGGQPWRRSNADDVMIYSDWNKDNFFHAVKSSLKDVKGKIGLELDHINVDDYAKLKQCFPGQDIVDIGYPTMQMRMIKSAAEIELIRQGARIADIGGEVACQSIVENVTEFEVANKVSTAMIKEIAATYPQSDIMDTWSWIQSGINTDGAHNPVTTRTIQRGDIISLNCFPMIQGYYTALERTLFLGEPTIEQLKIWQINCDVHKKGLEIIRPGAKCCDIAAELNEIYKNHNLLQYRSFGYGHSFGSLCHYYGREAALEIREDVETIILPGMVVSMEPMLLIPDGMPGAGGYREHDILVVKENDTENITQFPFGPENNVL